MPPSPTEARRIAAAAALVFEGPVTRPEKNRNQTGL